MKCLMHAWQQHEAELRGWLRRRLGNNADAEDQLQDLFLKALRQGERFCSLDNARAWLYEVARNALTDRLRLTRQMVELPESLASEAGETAAVDDLAYCLPRVLSELSADDREAITLCDVEGLTQQAYADRLGLTLPAAKSRVQRARERLRARLVEACKVRFDEGGHVCCFAPRPPL